MLRRFCDSKFLKNMAIASSLSASAILCLNQNPDSKFAAKLSPRNWIQLDRGWISSSSFSSRVWPWTKKFERNNNNMEFGTRIATHSILKEIKNGGNKNLVLSPLSLHIALNMLASGSTGHTLEQLLRVLESDDITHLNAQSSRLMELITRDDDGPIVCLVNGVWVDKHLPLKHSFKQLTEDVYKANAQSVDFVNQGKQVKKEINSWARKASKGHIDPMLDRPFSKDEILVLANAVYFKGTWDEKFKANYTRDGNFNLLNGETARVPFMKKYDTSKFYGSFDDFKLLKIQYKVGQSNSIYSMYIFLPHENDGLQRLVEKFNSNPRFVLENRELKKVNLDQLWLPKLKYKYELDVRESMKELGLDLPFDDKRAEIKEIVETSETIYVSQAFQKAYIEVDEEGTTAAAVTMFGPCGASPYKPPEVNFIADHPFLFMIKEEVSDTVLFVGAALNPLS